MSSFTPPTTLLTATRIAQIFMKNCDITPALLEVKAIDTIKALWSINYCTDITADNLLAELNRLYFP